MVMLVLHFFTPKIEAGATPPPDYAAAASPPPPLYGLPPLRARPCGLPVWCIKSLHPGLPPTRESMKNCLFLSVIMVQDGISEYVARA